MCMSGQIRFCASEIRSCFYGCSVPTEKFFGMEITVGSQFYFVKSLWVGHLPPPPREDVRSLGGIEYMTYKLNPEIGKILSAIILIFPEGERECYPDGEAVKGASFEKPYQITAIRAVDDNIEVTLQERRIVEITWNGEEEVSFF